MKRWEFGNPEMVAMRHEEASCKGCAYKSQIFGQDVCDHPTHRPKIMRKCKLFKLKGVQDGSK
jgi:hypothetical protein